LLANRAAGKEPIGSMPRCGHALERQCDRRRGRYRMFKTRAFEALLTRRRQLIEMLTAEKNRRTRAPKVLSRSIDKHIRWLEKRLSGFDDELATMIRDTLPSGTNVMSCCAPRTWGWHRIVQDPTRPPANWENSIASRSPPWQAWLRLTVTAVACAGVVASGDRTRRGQACSVHGDSRGGP
jgi:hypothetical protein